MIDDDRAAAEAGSDMVRDRRSPSPVARWLFVALSALMLVNALWCIAQRLLGRHFPYNNFLGKPADRFADFFKVALSYPDTRPFAEGNWLHLRGHLLENMLSGYDPRNPILTADHFTKSDITHFHLTPLTTLLSIGAGQAMRWIEPALLLLAGVIGLGFYVAQIVRIPACGRRDMRFWFAAFLVSYPMLMVIDRGNLFAGIAALLMIHASLLALAGDRRLLAPLLVAIAINIRPNAGLFLLPSLMWSGTNWIRNGATTMLVAGVIAGLSLLIAHDVYPDYTPASFAAGLDRYYALYVVSDAGLGYGSSLLGAAKLLFGYSTAAELACPIIALAIVVAAGLMRQQLSRTVFLFLLATATSLGSAVFGDYHLLVFLVVPMAFALERRSIDAATPDRPEAIALLVSCLVLGPKNYLYIDKVSAQVAINPLLLLFAAIAILAMTACRTGTRKGGPLPDRPSLARN